MTGDLVVVGMSHRTAPIELRERLALPASALGAELRGVVDGGYVHEALLVSTCNRVELYAACSDAAEGARTSEAYLERRAAQPLSDVLYRHTGSEAVRHAFRVASSLDSLVVGEPQILGQVKDAYEAANAAGAVGNLLGRCFSRAFAVAKRVRSETGIAEGTVSVSSIACELATKIFGDLATRRSLLIGAGDMGEAAARSLAQTGAQLVVVNRSLERAQSLADRCGGEARPYETMAMELVQADVVITSTASPAFVLTYELLRDVVRARRHRPLFLIDIAVPRDIDPRAAKLGGVFLYDVDDLQKVADENLSARRQHLASAEQIVDTEVADFEAWKRTLELTPTIVALRRRFADVVRSELERALPRVGALSTSERQALDKMVHATVNKLLHDPLTALKSGAAEPDGALLIATARRLFRIDEREAAELEETANANDLAPEAPALELATALGQNGERK
jgi:glutamyl-tRNA reductase